MLNGARINLDAFAKKKVEGTISRKITRFLTKGYFLDVKVIEDVVPNMATYEKEYQWWQEQVDAAAAKRDIERNEVEERPLTSSPTEEK